MTIPDAFFVRDRDRLVATELTRGPWSNDLQHGGPPAALLGGAIARHGDDAALFHVARVTLEFLRPIPIGAFEVRTEVVRAGHKVQRIAASLVREGVEVVRALGVRIRTSPLEVSSPPPVSVTGPDALSSFAFPFFRHPVGYHTAIDARFARGRWGQSPVTVWMRPKVALVAGEPTSWIERVLILVDAESGVCPPLPPDSHTFVNPDLTLYAERPHEGAWVGLEVSSSAASTGVGFAQSELFDARGAFGRSIQSLVVEPRSPKGPSAK